MSSLLESFKDHSKHSDREEGKNNVSKLLFDCEFECGNIGSAIKVSETEYDVAIREDTNNPRQAIWFYFRVRNAYANQRVLFHIYNYSKDKSLFGDGFTPVVRSTSRWRWERMPANQICWFRCPRHKRRNCLTILFQFDRPTDEYFFAYSYPYSYTKLQKYLHSLDVLDMKYYQRELLCRTTQQRRCDLIKISNPKNFQDKEKVINRVVFTARVHPGETPSSFVCHGIIEFLISRHPIAELLRENVIFYIIPMLNPDGVFIGNYRCSSQGLDLNRQWLNPEDVKEPTIVATKQMLLQLASDATSKLDVYIDIHAHSTSLSTFMYLNAPSEKQNDCDLIYPRMLDSRSTHFSFSKSRACTDPSKNGTGRRVMGNFLNKTSCYTLEISFYCSMINGQKSEPFSEISYLQLGREIIVTFIDYYNLSRDPVLMAPINKENKLEVDCGYSSNFSSPISPCHGTNDKTDVSKPMILIENVESDSDDDDENITLTSISQLRIEASSERERAQTIPIKSLSYSPAKGSQKTLSNNIGIPRAPVSISSVVRSPRVKNHRNASATSSGTYISGSFSQLLTNRNSSSNSRLSTPIVASRSVVDSPSIPHPLRISPTSTVPTSPGNNVETVFRRLFSANSKVNDLSSNSVLDVKTSSTPKFNSIQLSPEVFVDKTQKPVRAQLNAYGVLTTKKLPEKRPEPPLSENQSSRPRSATFNAGQSRLPWGINFKSSNKRSSFTFKE